MLTDIFTDFSKLSRQNRQISAQKIFDRQNRHLVIFSRNSTDLADKQAVEPALSRIGDIDLDYFRI